MERTGLTSPPTTHVVLVGDTEFARHGQHPLVPGLGGVQPALQEQGLDVGRESSLASLKIREDEATLCICIS